MIAKHQARRDAKQAAEFGPSLAHTLNNLLQVVNGNLELLSTRVQDEQLRGYVRNAQIAAQQITQLAHGLNGCPGD
jgi:nitrogen-specific signal transduction histidine kinase